MQESGYSVHKVYSACGRLKMGEEYEFCVYQDFGMSQVNYKTAKKYKYDVTKLIQNEEYSINAGAEVLQWFYQTYGKKEPNWWWTRYNCGVKPDPHKRLTCREYKRLTGRYL